VFRFILPAKVRLLSANGKYIASGAGQRSYNRCAYHSAVTCNEYPLVSQVEQLFGNSSVIHGDAASVRNANL
jgi:hypothetical protein